VTLPYPVHCMRTQVRIENTVTVSVVTIDIVMYIGVISKMCSVMIT